MKQSRVKKSAFAASMDPEKDAFLALGDDLILNGAPLCSVAEDDDEVEYTPWVFPELIRAASDATKTITRWMHAVFIRSSTSQEYKKAAVDLLTDNPTSGGVRPGDITKLSTLIPLDIVLQLTDHDLSSINAIVAYIRPVMVALQPGSFVPSFIVNTKR